MSQRRMAQNRSAQMPLHQLLLNLQWVKWHGWVKTADS